MSTETITYRDALPSDIPFMKQMLVESCAASGVNYISIENLSEHPDTNIYIKGWSGDTEPGVVAQTEYGECIGSAWLRNLPQLSHSVNEYLPEITIAVSPSHRNKGIATNMMSQLYKKCVVMGITRISLGVHHQNLPALNLYKKQGWQEDGRYKDYIMMSKKLITNQHAE